MDILTETIIGAGTLAFIVALWNQIKALFSYVRNVLFVSAVCEGNDDLGGVVLRYLTETCRGRYSLGDKTYGNFDGYILPEERVGRVAYLARWRSSTVFMVDACKLGIAGGLGKRLRAHRVPVLMLGAGGNESGAISFIFLRGMVDWTSLTRAAIDHEDRHGTEEDSGPSAVRYKVYRMSGHRVKGKGRTERAEGAEAPEKEGGANKAAARGGHELLHYTWDDIGSPEPPCALDRLSLNSDQDRIVREIEFWARSEPWFKQRGIPWKRGFLFYGPPGCGKTSLTRALAEKFDFPVFLFDLASMTNQDLIRFWGGMLSHAPCIALFEDIDAVFCGRDNVTNTEEDSNGVTFDCLLNCLDGVEAVNGLLTIVTTNFVEKVDCALSGPMGAGETEKEGAMPTRPGRIDRTLLFGALNAEGRRKMAIRILDEGQDVEALVKAGEQDAAAQFMERAFRKALDWRFEQWDAAEAAKLAAEKKAVG